MFDEIGPVISLKPDSARAAGWLAVFNRLEHIPVTTYWSVLANLPDRPDAPVYMLDLKRITPEERERLIAFIAGRFDIPMKEVELDIDRHGCPVLAEDTLAPAIPFRLIV